MKLLRRNIRPVWYCLYKRTEDLKNSDGRFTGEKNIIYDEPVEILCNVSPASGYIQNYMFGLLEEYDKIMITDDINCPISESTVLFIDKVPEFIEKKKKNKELEWDSSPIYDYVVRRISKSLNHITYVVKKVSVS